MKTPKISVIIPVYKVEKYLKKCINSVIKQTYKDIEIILVDDGSPDACPEICDDFAKKDSRINVIHKQNGGLSSARNAGLDIAVGQYVYFLDSDDYIEPNTLEIMIKKMRDNSIDIVIGGVKPFFEGKIKPNNFDNMVNYFSVFDKQVILDANQILQLPVIACEKLYKKSIIDEYNLRFDEGLINEDEAFNWYYNTKIKFGIFVPNKFYNYLIRPDSIVGNKQKGQKIGDLLQIVDKVYEHLKTYKLLSKYKRKFKHWATSMINSAKRLAQTFNDQTLVNKCDEYHKKYATESFAKKVFSVYNSYDGKYKIIKICGIKIKLQRKNNN